VAPTLAHVTPKVLHWARESAGFTLGEAARHIKVSAWQLEMAEDGVDLLTLRQAESLADFYGRPLSMLFMPEEPAEEPTEVQFRRLPGSPPPPWPPAMHLLSRRIRARQQAAEELHELLDEPPAWPGVAESLRTLPSLEVGTAAAAIRDLLGVSLAEQTEWRDPSGYRPLRSWVDAVEALGVYVMQDGSMPVDQLRGFAVPHPTVPVIVVSTKDHPHARAFSLVHELGHLVLAAAGKEVGSKTEGWCEEFAGQLLVPPSALEARWDPLESRLQMVTAVASHFQITRAAAAVRAARAGLLPQNDADEILTFLRSEADRIAAEVGERESKGNYYRNKIAWLGPGFIRLVFDAVDGQAVTLSNAAGLLEAKVDHFAELRTKLDEREQV
jgi:Zn-dependent peptidase ImmA (M78 family)